MYQLFNGVKHIEQVHVRPSDVAGTEAVAGPTFAGAPGNPLRIVTVAIGQIRPGDSPGRRERTSVT